MPKIQISTVSFNDPDNFWVHNSTRVRIPSSRTYPSSPITLNQMAVTPTQGKKNPPF